MYKEVKVGEFDTSRTRLELVTCPFVHRYSKD